MGRKMRDSLLEWLGHDKPPSVRVSHKLWRKHLVDRTRQLSLGVDRARQQSDMLLFHGTDIVGTVEAVGAGHEPAQVEAGPGPAVEERASDAEEWEVTDMGDWIAGTGGDPGYSRPFGPGQKHDLWTQRKNALVLLPEQRHQ